MSKKRIHKEIELLIDKYNNVTVEKINEKNYFIKIIDKNVQYSMQTDDNYPFQPPRFYIKNIEYYKWLSSVIPSIEYIYKDTNIGCLCCRSILCNWSPGYMFINLINEFKNLRIMVFNIIGLKYLRIILKKFNENYDFNSILKIVTSFFIE